ncbi:MAG: SIMPL domain-containing protein [Hydrogenophaga sp.]
MIRSDSLAHLSFARCQTHARKLGRQWVLGVALAVVVLPASVVSAEPVSGDRAPANVVSLSSSGFLTVPQDWLTVRLNAAREVDNAAAVQAQLRTALDSGMATARAAVAPNQQLQARSGAFGVYPHYDKNGKISGWQGNAELILEGRDFTRIANTAGKIAALTIAGMDFSLSRETQQKLESDVQALAIDRFKSRAKEVAKGFGFNDFRLREINISSADEGGGMPQPRMMAMDAKAYSSASKSVTMEPGSAKVSVTVSGTVMLK